MDNINNDLEIIKNDLIAIKNVKEFKIDNDQYKNLVLNVNKELRSITDRLSYDIKEKIDDQTHRLSNNFDTKVFQQIKRLEEEHQRKLATRMTYYSLFIGLIGIISIFAPYLNSLNGIGETEKSVKQMDYFAATQANVAKQKNHIANLPDWKKEKRITSLKVMAELQYEEGKKSHERKLLLESLGNYNDWLEMDAANKGVQERIKEIKTILKEVK